MRELTAAAEENAKALNAAQLFEIDDVIDPAETRGLIAATLRRPRPRAADARPALRRHLVGGRLSPGAVASGWRGPPPALVERGMVDLSQDRSALVAEFVADDAAAAPLLDLADAGDRQVGRTA